MENSPNTIFNVRTVGDITVLDIEGEFSITRCPVPTLQDLGKERLDRGARKILINLEKSPFVDSLGIGQIFAIYISAHNLGGDLRLAAVPPRVLAVLVVTGIVPRVLQAYPTEAAALESFARLPPPAA